MSNNNFDIYSPFVLIFNLFFFSVLDGPVSITSQPTRGIFFNKNRVANDGLVIELNNLYYHLRQYKLDNFVTR